jgi:CheY-like chemotaxis protein
MRKVLVIDDSSFQRKIISGVLTQNGFEVVLTENGKEGLERALQEKPDLIFTDLLMPEYDGFWLLEQLKSHGLSIPVIVLTSDIQKTTGERCRDLGAVTILNKPVNKEQVISAVRTILGNPLCQ